MWINLQYGVLIERWIFEYSFSPLSSVNGTTPLEILYLAFSWEVGFENRLSRTETFQFLLRVVAFYFPEWYLLDAGCGHLIEHCVKVNLIYCPGLATIVALQPC